MNEARPSPHPPGSADALGALVAGVQRNCHIADARHAAGMTLCTYLLQMRELYRWERGLPLGTPLAREAVGAWMSERETLWDTLAEEDYRPLPLPGSADATADPFDVEAVNEALAPLKLLYGAGLVLGDRPVFFLADLHDRGWREGLAVLQAGRERARTLFAPPAALGGSGAGPIVLRRESMARWCWERTEAHAMRPRPGTAMHAMLAHYGLGRDFGAGLPRWLDDQCETAAWHEIGEHRLGARWGARWGELREAVRRVGAEAGGASEGSGAGGGGQGGAPAVSLRGDALVRALRDLLADLGVTLPALLARSEPGPLHAWFAGYEGLREASFPALAEGYRAWRGPADAGSAVGAHGDGGTLLRAQCAHGLCHLEALAVSLLEGPQARREAALARLLQAAPGGVPPAMQVPWPPVGR